jgi:hypothetical protein
MSLWRSVRPIFLLMAGSATLLTGACGAPVAVAGAGYAADGTLMATSNKTSSDHLASIVTKQDCALWRVFQGQPVCKEREGDKDPYDVDYTHAERTVAEDGVHYVPPLRPAANAPATSWDAAAYQSAPQPPSQVKMASTSANTAVVSPSPASAKKATAAKKTKVAHKKPVKKPSRDQAAPGS